MIPIRNILNKENAITNFKYKNNRIFIFECTNCKSELRVQRQYIPKHTGLCVKCAQYDKPFKACYSSLLKSAKNRGQVIDITYEQFLTFTNNDQCHYCHSHIAWYAHTSKDKHISKDTRSYKLDRKDNSKGYTLDNCVVCCWKCNQTKGSIYSYDEWYGMTEYFRKNKKERMS